ELAKKLDATNGRITAYDRDIEVLRAEVKALRASNRGDEGLADLDRKLGALRAEVDALRKPTATPSELDAARSLFRSRRYAEAANAFRALTESHPDDARIWYFAALAK